MARIEIINENNAKTKSQRKRKIKENSPNVNEKGSDSPSGKFRRLNILDVQTKTTKLSKPPQSKDKLKRLNMEATLSTEQSNMESRKSLKKRNIPISYSPRKKIKSNIEQQNNSNEDDREELYEPTHNEIIESTKPENVIQIETKRQKKRNAHQNSVENKHKDAVKKEHQKNIDYLKNWEFNRTTWKFEKLRQISIQHHIFNENLINDEIWTTGLNYLAGTKGSARLQLINKAEKIINSIDEQINESNQNELTSSITYKRAREMLQMLQ